jgi:hypothetical protein
MCARLPVRRGGRLGRGKTGAFSVRRGLLVECDQVDLGELIACRVESDEQPVPGRHRDGAFLRAGTRCGQLREEEAGGARVQPDALRRFERLGIDSVVLALDNDASGRDGTARAVERITSLTDAPTLRVLDPEQLGDSKDPDAFVREHGVTSFGALVADADCAVSWRAREFVRGITPDSEARRRRAALACAGSWLGTLRPRYALEQEDAVRQVSERCGYSREAVQRAFRARFWDRLEGRGRAGLVIER